MFLNKYLYSSSWVPLWILITFILRAVGKILILAFYQHHKCFAISAEYSNYSVAVHTLVM